MYVVFSTLAQDNAYDASLYSKIDSTSSFNIISIRKRKPSTRLCIIIT